MDRDSVTMHVMGKSRFGKSYWVKNTLLPILKKQKPVIVFDRKGEYAGPRAKDVPEKWNRYRSIFYFFGSLKESKVITPGIHVITCTDDRDYVYGVRFFNELQKERQPVTLVFEEASDLLKAKDFVETKDTFKKMARHGSHDNLGIVLISQKTLDAPPEIRSQLTVKVSFHQSYKGDVKALIEDGFDEAEKILDLEPREYLIYSDRELPTHLKTIKKGANNE